MSGRQKTLRPFFTYYGGKWRAARHYPAPRYGHVVEPFAGSAGYALRYPDRAVLLVDADPAIVGVWDYIIRAPESEIRSLPVEVKTTDALDVPQEAKWLIGFWLNKGAATPCKSPSSWMRSGTHEASFWGEAIRERIASQQAAVRHWRITEGSYETIPDAEATWFVDPPYSTPAGRYYRFSDVDYEHLAEWCLARKGQVIVCEQDGADWLPFRPFREIKANESSRGKGVSREVIWTAAPDDEVAA